MAWYAVFTVRLQSGEIAPDFTAKTIDGEEVSLRDYRGRKVWLTFFRYAACPLCSYRIHELLTQWDSRFAGHNFELLTVWQSPPEKLGEVRERYDPAFALITDPQLELYQKYRVEKGFLKAFGKDVFEGLAGARKLGIKIVRAWDGPATRCPADFLIDEEGTIQTAFYGENVAQMIPLDDVEDFLAA